MTAKNNSRSKSAQQKATIAAQENFIPTMRELVLTYQAFADYSAKHLRTLNLTPSQFDVIATLGNTAGMNMTDIATRTLVTKGYFDRDYRSLGKERFCQTSRSSRQST